MQIAPTPHHENNENVIYAPPIEVAKPTQRVSLRASSQRWRSTLVSLARSMSSSASLTSSPCGSTCSSASSGSTLLRMSSKSSFAVKRKRAVRFAKKAPSVQRLPPRHQEDKGELWWSADELEKMSVSEVVRVLCVSGDVSIGRYLVGSDRFHQHVCDHRRPVSSYDDPDPILAGLNLGYRGIEKWTDSGRFRRIESREFVKKVVYEQMSMTPEQIRELCVAHSHEFVEYANATAYLDALVVEQ